MMLKILGIGLPKTGTRSMTKALRILGYKSLHGGPELNYALVNNKIDYDFLDNYDAVFDGFCCLKFMTLDSHYDNLKFIYTTRKLESWLSSCKHRFRGRGMETIPRMAICGSDVFNKEIWTSSYIRHKEKVKEYFKGRNDILEIDIESDNKWEKLCGFLDCKIPDVDFPWRGARRGKKMNQDEIDKLYSKRFFKRRIAKYHFKEIEAAKIIYQMFKPKSVFDVGCGIGSYLLEYKRLGCVVSGCDKYLDNAKKFCDPEILPYLYTTDAGLMWENDVDNKFDLIQCIEVAEHLLPVSSLNLIYNLCKLSSKYILFTAASPGQKGTGHINCRKKEFWIKLFKLFGFLTDIDNEINIKEKLKDFTIFKNLMLLKKEN